MSNLLIATIKKLILWDGKQHTVSEGNFYGITWDDKVVYCSRNEPHVPVSTIKMFDKKTLNPAGKLPLRYLNGVHQILFFDEQLHIAYTMRNRVDVYDGSQTVKSFNWTNCEDDKHHMNSIWADRNNIYIAESGLGGNEDHPPAIQVLSKKYIPLSKVELPGAIHIHNVYVENGTLYSCGKFGLIKKKLSQDFYTLIDLRKDKRNGFFRGFARSKEKFFIGESQILPREERSYGDANVITLNNHFEIDDIITLKDTGQIQDIRIVNEPDLAHNGIALNLT